MTKMPLISVIVPAYNVSNSIAMTLDLLRRQTYDNLEIICINDGSTDSTPDIINALKQKDSRIVLINKRNGGVSSARNIGLNTAHGEYVCFFDPGDEADSNFVMYLYKLLLSEKADLAICSYNFKMENGQILDRKRFYEIVDTNTIFNQEEALTEIIKAYGKFCGHVWDKLFVRNIIGNIRFDENIHNCEDTLFNVQYIKRCRKVILGPEVHYNYIQSDSSVTHGKYSYKFHSGLCAWRRIIEELDSYVERELLNKNMSALVTMYSRMAWKSLNREEQRKYKKEFIKLMNQYHSFSSIKQLIKRVICKIYWIAV